MFTNPLLQSSHTGSTPTVLSIREILFSVLCLDSLARLSCPCAAAQRPPQKRHCHGQLPIEHSATASSPHSSLFFNRGLESMAFMKVLMFQYLLKPDIYIIYIDTYLPELLEKSSVLASIWVYMALVSAASGGAFPHREPPHSSLNTHPDERSQAPRLHPSPRYCLYRTTGQKQPAATAAPFRCPILRAASFRTFEKSYGVLGTQG